jgi:thiamine biosynthesis protein ThiI
MHPPGADVVLVRHGDIGVKSEQVRRTMESRLVENLEAMLEDRDVAGRVEQRRNRLFVHTDDPEGVAAVAADTFGVSSVSPAARVDPTLEAICDALAAATRTQYDGGPFAVDARRAGPADAHPFSSPDIESEGGAAVWDAVESLGGDPEVDLEDPEFQLFVECRRGEAFVFLERRAGPGGFPLGTQQPMVALVSGGIDSPVAAWSLMRRGCPVIPVYVDLGDYGGVDHRARAISTVEALASYGPTEDFATHVVDAGTVVGDLVATMGAERMLALRRFILRAAETVATDVGAVGIVTGEAVGQKSSQTSANLAVTDAATSLPVHRPLLTMDKPEITQRARSIGTFRESTVDTGRDRVAPSLPETNAALEQVRDAEPDDLFERARAAAADRTVVPIEK